MAGPGASTRVPSPLSKGTVAKVLLAQVLLQVEGGVPTLQREQDLEMEAEVWGVGRSQQAQGELAKWGKT